MNALRKTTLAPMLAAIGAAAVLAISGAAQADHHALYSYETKYGDFEFYNYDGHWPIVRKVKYYNKWYRCSFWSDRYDCERDHGQAYDSGFKSYNKGYNNSSYRRGYNKYHDEDCRD